MSWAEKMQEWGGGDIAFLSEDGEAIIFIIVGDPVLLEGTFKGRSSHRIGWPVITREGYTLFICGKRLSRRLSKYEAQAADHGFMIVRHGIHNDITTSYDLSFCQDPDLVQGLFEWKATEFDAEAIAESVAAAQAVVSS